MTTTIEMNQMQSDVGARNRKKPPPIPNNNTTTKNKMSEFPKEKMKRIDYVLVYNKKNMDDIVSEKKTRQRQKKIELQEKFEAALLEEGVEIESEEIHDTVYQKLHTPFHRLCQEAEKVKLEMPLIGVSTLT